MNECAVAELADGRLMLNMRSNRGKSQRGVALSDDGGISWSECRNDSTLMEPVCQASLLRYSWGEGGDNSRLLFSNPASPVSRDHMTLRVSYDDGKTWPVTHQVYEGSSSYSCLTRLQTGSIGLLYEREDYREIVYTGINLSAIESPVSDPESPGSERR